MSVSTRSRTSSLFSLASTASSCTSGPPSPTLSVTKQPAQQPTTQDSPPIVLKWRSQVFSAAFSFSRSTNLHFTAFPPQDVPKAMFQSISQDAAFSILYDHSQPTTLSLFATPQSKITPIYDISIPSNLPCELIDLLHSDEWYYYTVGDSISFPIGISNFASGYEHHVAVRNIHGGIEKYIFGPGGLSIHSVCQIQDKGTRYVEDIPRETLYLEEKTEVLCNKTLKWWFESQVSKRTAEAHQSLRVRWDDRFRGDCRLTQCSEKADLLH